MKSQRGVVLVIVLSFVVLLTILVVAFLSRSLLTRQIFNSRAGQSEVEFMTDNAVEFMKADLRQEITSGSTIYSAVNSSGVAVPIYVPTINSTILPARTGFTPGATIGSDPLDNIVKISKAGVSFFSGSGYSATYPSPNFASAVSTGAPALNGRYIDNSTAGWTTAGWDRPQLIDVTKYGASSLLAVPIPDWIYVTTTGRKVLPQPDSTVVGRYAFVIYDEGGLLDINSAGYPSSLSSSDARDPARKGSLALADLTQLPGGMTSAMQDALVAWRNQATSASSTFSTVNYPTLSAPTFLKYLFNSSLNKGGVLTYPGDQKFLSRQELVAYSAANPSILPAESLAYLTTFTRTLNAPTWTPTNSPGSSFDYTSKSENASGATWPYNVDSINTRWTADVTITRPKLDEDTSPTATTVTTETVTFHKGDPVIQHRFPLSKIALLSNPAAQTSGASGTTGTVAWAVNYYFGLTWVTTDKWLAEPHWEYSHGTTTATLALANYIHSIPEVAALATKREPDFFEMLRQGVLKGSAHDIMILEMGASIIDQFDADDEPTAITSTASAPFREAFGKENLPYFSQMLLWPYRPVSDPTRVTFEAYLIPMLWNPHRNASSISPNIENFRMSLIPGTGATPIVTISNGTTGYNTSGLTTTGTLTFTSSTTTTYQEPTILSGGIGAPAGGSGITESPTNRSGFYLGNVAAPDINIAKDLGGTGTGLKSLTKAAVTTVAPDNGTTPPTLTIQCQYPDGSWRTYENIALSFGNVSAQTGWQTTDILGANSANAAPSFSSVSGNDAHDYYGFESVGPVDPRVSSGSGLGGSRGIAETDNFNASISTAGTGATWRPLATLTPGSLALSVVGSEFGWFPNNSPPGTQIYGSSNVMYLAQWSENNTQTNAYYLDYDSIGGGFSGDMVQRPGDGAYGAFPMASNQIQDRPVILNRPFRSVGELGYAYRGAEWKTVDFSSAVSGDSGLLDTFSIGSSQKITQPSSGVTISTPLATGVLNINTRHPEVLQALLSGGLKNDLDTTAASVISSSQVSAIAQAIVAETSNPAAGHGPLLNRSDLVDRIMPLTGVTTALTGTTSKPEREAVIRALAESADTRTWNLLIDLVVQAGRFPTSAVNAGSVAALSQFDAQGERRYWLHLAIDRYTGKVIDEQLEVVRDN